MKYSFRHEIGIPPWPGVPAPCSVRRRRGLAVSPPARYAAPHERGSSQQRSPDAVGGGGGAFRAIFITLVVLNLVASFQAFGTLLAIGPMLLPAAAARCWTRKVWPMIALATVFGMAASLAGLLISYYANLPSGPAIVMGAALIYGISLAAARMRLKTHKT